MIHCEDMQPKLQRDLLRPRVCWCTVTQVLQLALTRVAWPPLQESFLKRRTFSLIEMLCRDEAYKTTQKWRHLLYFKTMGRFDSSVYAKHSLWKSLKSWHMAMHIIHCIPCSLNVHVYICSIIHLCFTTIEDSTQGQEAHQAAITQATQHSTKPVCEMGGRQWVPSNSQMRDNMQNCGSITTMHSNMLNFHTPYVVYKGIGIAQAWMGDLGECLVRK